MAMVDGTVPALKCSFVDPPTEVIDLLIDTHKNCMQFMVTICFQAYPLCQSYFVYAAWIDFLCFFRVYIFFTEFSMNKLRLE